MIPLWENTRKRDRIQPYSSFRLQTAELGDNVPV